MTADLNHVKKRSERGVGTFSTQEQYNCPMCGSPCVCERLNLFPSVSPVFATIYWRCERCIPTKDGEPNGN